MREHFEYGVAEVASGRIVNGRDPLQTATIQLNLGIRRLEAHGGNGTRAAAFDSACHVIGIFGSRGARHINNLGPFETKVFRGNRPNNQNSRADRWLKAFSTGSIAPIPCDFRVKYTLSIHPIRLVILAL